MLQQPYPDDYVIASGRRCSLRNFVEISLGKPGLNWHDYVIQDPKFYRPAGIPVVVGDFSKARDRLGWTPQTTLEELVELMLENDHSQLQRKAAIGAL